MAIILSFIRWAKEWWYNHFFIFVFFFSKFIVQNRDDLTFFTVWPFNVVTPIKTWNIVTKLTAQTVSDLFSIVGDQFYIVQGSLVCLFAKNGQKISQNGKKRQYFVHHWKAQGFDNNPYGNHYKLWLSRQYTNPVFIRKRNSRYNLNYYYRREGGKNFFNPPITGMRVCDKSFFAKNSQISSQNGKKTTEIMRKKMEVG